MKFSTEVGKTVNVKFENLTDAQAVALEEFFAAWQLMSDTREFSMWTGFWCDAKNDFNPKITFNGHSPKRFMKDIGLRMGKVKMLQWDDTEIIQNMYFCDYVKIEEVLEKDLDDDSEK